jgi:hypothetical protein
MYVFIRSVLLLLLAATGRTLVAETDDLNTQLVLSTIKVSHPDSTGTAFVLVRQSPNDPKKTQFVLVTAGHVLSRIKDDEATLHLRKQESGGRYSKLPVKIKLRHDGKALWTRHPTADVAAMYVSLPPEASVPGVPLALLASDDDLRKYDVHPGDIIRGVGFPHPNQFEANEAGFPLVRMGCIASYPLLPTKETKTFFIDLNTFEGDSGAPVYLLEANRLSKGNVHEGQVQLILGLVLGQQFLDEEIKSIYQVEKFRHCMGLGIVVHATAIHETVDLLPRNP